MALSDQLAKLSAQAKDLEDSARAAEQLDKQRLAARASEIKAALEQAGADIEAESRAEVDDVARGWNKLKGSVADDFGSLRDSVAEKHAAHQAKRADRRADTAEEEAADAVEFAVYALEQAEYYVLAAAQARIDAADAELNAEIKAAE